MTLSKLIPVLATAVAVAAPVPLQNPTATFSQTVGASFLPPTLIDTILTGGLGQGWAIDDFPNGSSAQTVVFETVTDLGGPGGSNLFFRLTHGYTVSGQHTIGRFRLSYTTDDRSTFADGLASGGDVTASWTVLVPVVFTATNGATMTLLGDNSILVGGPSPATSVYDVSAVAAVPAITGIRLEVMEDPSLPFSGPGRQSANGNFVLTEFELDATDVETPEPSSIAMTLIGAAALMLRRKLA